MRGVKAQYFLSFAVMGTTMPFIARYLQSRGLDASQIGYVISTAGVAAIAMPPIMALLADTRFDNRRLDEIRNIEIEVGVLPRTHGSALFTRGETQAIVVTTLGTARDGQIIDAVSGEYKENFLFHVST